MKRFDLNSILKKADELFEKQDAGSILTHINSIKVYLDKDISTSQKVQLAYSIGTSYEDYITIKSKDNNFNFEKYTEKAIYYFDYAFDLISNEENKELYFRLVTNYANACRSCGRTIKAIELYNRIKNFPMAQGNLGITLSHFAPLQYDEMHTAILFKEAYLNFIDALKNEKYLKQHGDAISAFQNEISRIQKILRPEYLNEKYNFKNYSWGKTKKEKEYKKWVADNNLYLNVMNDLFKDSFVTHDFLHLPTMHYSVDNPRDEFDCAIMNEIKQEYVSARYRLFESLDYIKNKNHIADKNVDIYELTDTEISCNYYDNLIRSSFKDFYSILDRIAYFVNQYFGLGLDLEKVSFRAVMNDKKMKEVIKSNFMINGLYWSSKDVFEENYTTTKYKSNNYAKLRNYLEHRIVISTIGIKEMQINENEIFISQYGLFNYTYNLMKLVRECIIYLVLGINIEEKNKSYNVDTINLTRVKILDKLK